MSKIPEFLEPKDQKPDRRVEIEWQTISYRTVAIIGVLLVMAAAVIVYLLYPEQIRRGFAKLLRSDRETTGPVFEQRQARFLNIDGNVRVKKANEAKWAAASLDLPLEKGDVVQTSGGGRARLSFADGTV